MSTRAGAILLIVAAAAGLLFASVSTFDFVQHLDRQVHDLHCSFAPGLVEADEKSTGCQVTLLSPYSSVMRTSLWGGIPISLGAMAIFALLGYRAVELLGRPASERGTAGAILLVLTIIPVVASIVMGTIALRELHAVCKLCIGIYISSAFAFVGGLIAWRGGKQEADLAERARLREQAAAAKAAMEGDEAVATTVPSPPTSPAVVWMAAAGQLFAFTSVPIVAYAAAVPDHARFIGTCGGLIHPDDDGADLLVALPGKGDVPVIEVFDPLCPACRGLDERLHASDIGARLDRKALLFPLDSECNWMVQRSLHPGACRVSEAVLCADENDKVGVDEVIAWAFAEQESLTKAGEKDPDEVTERIASRFAPLKSCLGSAEVQARLNKSLRWTVANKLAVLTPQLFIDGVKVCDEDTDLGLDFTLERMLQLHDQGKLAAMAPDPVEEEPALVPGSEAPPRDTKAKGKRKPAPKAAPKRPAKPAGDAGSASGDAPKGEQPEPAAADDGLPSIEELPPAGEGDAQ